MTNDKTPRLRGKAFAVLRRGDSILVGFGTDRVKGTRHGRIVGGGIEFGELSQQTIMREMKEEFDLDVSITRSLGWLENIFTYEGTPGHEIIALYEVTCAPDHPIFTQEDITILDCPNDIGGWLSPERMAREGINLYPTGAAELIWPKQGSQE